jgi:hypothetical protein
MKYILRHGVDLLVLLIVLGSFIWGEIDPKIQSENALVIASGYIIFNIINKARLVN